MIRQCKLYILIPEILACRPIYIHIQLFSLKLNYPSYKLNTLNWGTYWEIINVIIIKFIVAIYCQFLIDYTWGNDVCIKLWEASHSDFKAIYYLDVGLFYGQSEMTVSFSMCIFLGSIHIPYIFCNKSVYKAAAVNYNTPDSETMQTKYIILH